MPALTRRREADRHQESWQVYFGDVRIGWIGERAGVPKSVEQWGWCCGFYPRDGHVSGTAESFDQARADFERAWHDYLPRCRPDDFDAHRYQTAATAWKYAMWDAVCRMPTQTVDGWSKCFCGAAISNKTSVEHIRACHMETADAH
jgi:hypothetical protein